MSVVTFAGTTLWDDSATGRSRVMDSVKIRSVNWVMEQLPRNGGIIAKDNGDNPDGFIMECLYWLTTAQADTLAETIAGARLGFGDVNFPPNRTIENCILIDASMSRTGKQQVVPGSSHTYEYIVLFRFQQLS